MLGLFKAERIKWTILVWSLISFCISSHAQKAIDTTQPPLTSTQFGLTYHHGFIIPHSRTIKDVANSYPQALELSFSRLNTSYNSWNKCNCYNRWGAALTYLDFNNDPILGQAYTLVFFFEPIFSSGRKFELSGKAGLGLGYVTKVFDPIENPTNLFFSSNWNFPLMVGLNLGYRATERWRFDLTANYNHMSNGGMSQPNKGMNYPMGALGVQYVINPTSLPERTVKKERNYPWNKYVVLFCTSKSASDSTYKDQGRKPLVGIQVGLLKRLTTVYGINAGFEAIYDESNKQGDDQSDDGYNAFTGAAVIGNNLFFGRFHFNQQLAFYFERPTPTSKALYQRYSLDYFISSVVKVGVSLKAHGHVADNIDVRLGFVL